jgi:hypothetical protein
MAAVDGLLFATAAGFGVVVVATVLVIVGVRQEERRGAMAKMRPPTIPALLARRVLGTYVRLLREDQTRRNDPSQRPPEP